MIRMFAISLSAWCFCLLSPAYSQPDPGLPLDPIVQDMITEVSADTLFDNLVRLVGFETRHTNSDTVSDTRGIGAARRFVMRQFQNYADDPMTVDLQPSYFIFNATVCGVAGEHRNILATLAGSDSPERNFLVMGHLDSRNQDNCDAVGNANGANDDCSGTVVAMEMARVMSRYQLESTMILMPVTGEEQGLLGSEAYADFAVDQGMRIDGVLTNDVVGNVEGCANPNCPPGEPVIIDSMSVRHFSGDPSDGLSRQLARYMKLQGLRYMNGFDVNLIAALDRPGRGGDHIPFHDLGFAAARFTEPNEMGVGDGSSGRQHNVFDTISALNTNKGYMANIARTSIAGFASLALAPASPEGLEAFDGGDGESVFLTWPAGQNEPDFAGYMVAVRDPDSLYYTSFLDAGMAQDILVAGLIPGEEIRFSIAAYDSPGNLSLFSPEVAITPSALPRPPARVHATSAVGEVTIRWDPNTELDVIRYRIYRSSVRTSGFTLDDSVAVPLNEYVDTGLAPHMLFYYQLRAFDNEGMESLPSATVAGQLATHDLGILVVDGTRDGNGSALAPTDQMVDDQYEALLSSFSIGGHYDVADTVGLGYLMYDADLAPYSTVVWHTDVRGSSPLHADTSSLRKYLQQGGRLVIGGWKLSSSLLAGAMIGVTTYPSGTFMRDVLQVDSTRTSGALSQDFMTATGAFSGYPDIPVDAATIPLYNGTLVNTDAVLTPFVTGGVEVLYTHHGSPGSLLEGKPVGWRFPGPGYQIAVFDFPLYYMLLGPARTALTEVLEWLGEPTGVTDSGAELPSAFRLSQNYPNPFNPSTEIRFDLPVKADVSLVVYDMLGQQIAVLFEEERSAGAHRAFWAGKSDGGAPVSSGIYFYELRAVGSGGTDRFFSAFRKMVFLK